MSKKDEIIDELNKTVNDDDLDDDSFEKLLNAEIQTDEEKRLQEEEQNKKVTDDQPTREELEAKIAELERDAKGKLADTVKSRQERRQMKDELVELKSAVSSLLDKKKELESTPKPLEDPKQKIEFAEDESAFVDLSPVTKAIEESENKTKQELAELREAQRRQEIKDSIDQQVNSVIDIDRGKYEPAYKKLQLAAKAFNDRVIEMQNRTDNLGDKDGGLDVDLGLDLMDGTPEEKAFKKDFPGLNPIFIARAFNSKRDLRNALDNVSSTLKDDTLTEKLNDQRIKDAKSKPGSLTKEENQGLAGDTLLDKITSLDTNDILNISDAEEERIMKLLLEEEVRGD